MTPPSGTGCAYDFRSLPSTPGTVPATPKEPRDPLKLAHYYPSLLDSGQFKNRAALARYLGVSRARVTRMLRRLSPAWPGKRCLERPVKDAFATSALEITSRIRLTPGRSGQKLSNMSSQNAASAERGIPDVKTRAPLVLHR
jgi:hypothetical protein